MAVNIKELHKHGVGIVDLSDTRSNVARKVRVHLHKDNVKHAIVAVEDRGNYQSYTSGKVTASMITETQRERELVNSMRKHYHRWAKSGDPEEWLAMEERSLEWEIEWRIAKGELNTNIIRWRPRVALPVNTDENVVRWRNMEKQLNIEPLVRLKEMKEPLTIPTQIDTKTLEQWLHRLTVRSKELTRITRAEHRAHIFEATEERKKWKDAYIDGKVKGLVAKVLDKMNGVHVSQKVWLPHETGLRLSCSTNEVKEEAERFF